MIRKWYNNTRAQWRLYALALKDRYFLSDLELYKQYLEERQDFDFWFDAYQAMSLQKHLNKLGLSVEDIQTFAENVGTILNKAKDTRTGYIYKEIPVVKSNPVRGNRPVFVKMDTTAGQEQAAQLRANSKNYIAL